MYIREGTENQSVAISRRSSESTHDILYWHCTYPNDDDDDDSDTHTRISHLAVFLSLFLSGLFFSVCHTRLSNSPQPESRNKRNIHILVESNQIHYCSIFDCCKKKEEMCVCVRIVRHRSTVPNVPIHDVCAAKDLRIDRMLTAPKTKAKNRIDCVHFC